jgi:enoyl-CoA hydratase/carnithine racemase
VSTVLVDVADGVATVTLNRPEQMNSVTVELAEELEAVLEALGARDDAGVVVLRGAGANFSAGGDFDEVQRLTSEGPEALRVLFEAFARATAVIAKIDTPVIAAVQGVAAAGGFELMQAADFAVVADDARIADNHIRFGMIPGGGSTQRLARLIGRQQALGLLLSGDRISGTDAYRVGLAYACWPAAEFDQRLSTLTTTLAGRSREAVAGIKRLVNDNLESPLRIGIEHEVAAVVDHIIQGAGNAAASTFAQRKA